MRGASAFSRRPGHPSSRGRFPFGSGLPGVNVAQGFIVDSSPATLGVLPIAQGLVVAGEPSYSAYTPLAEGGADIWFDLQDAASYTVSGGVAVTSLVNKISGVAMVPRVTSCPYEATGLVGKPCLHPLAVTDGLRSTEAAVLASLNSTGVAPATVNPVGTIYYVTRPDNISTAGAVFSIAQTGGTNGQRRWGYINTGNGRHSTTHRNDDNTQTTPTQTTAQDYSVAAREIVCWTFGAGVTSCFVNNVATSIAVTACDPCVGGTKTFTGQRFALFCVDDNSADTPFVGRFGEFWKFNNIHDAAAQTRVVNYLNGRW